MTIAFSQSKVVPRTGHDGRSNQESPNHAKAKTRQSYAIRQLSNALAEAGFVTVDEQAKVLGLCRSTMWTIAKSNHKGSGLSATIINRALAAPHLPALVRAKILAYVEEKAAGRYGHGKTQRRKFIAQLSIDETAQAHLNLDLSLPALRRQLSLMKSGVE
jgi:hypothetical protein